MRSLATSLLPVAVCWTFAAFAGCGDADASAPAAPESEMPDDAGVSDVVGADALEAGSSSDAGDVVNDATTTSHGTVGTFAFVGPWAGPVDRIVESRVDPSTLFAMGGDRLFRSTDGAGSWTALSTPDHHVMSLAAAPDGRVIVGTEAAVYASVDDGGHWQTLGGGMEPGSTGVIRVSALGWEEGPPARLWAGLANYDVAPVWVLEDGTSSWTPWNEPEGWSQGPLQGDAHVTDIAIREASGSSASQVLVAYELAFAQGGGVLCSLDGGCSFESCSSGLPPVPFHRIHAYDNELLVAGGSVFGGAYGGVFRASVAGDAWSPLLGGWSEPIANDVIRRADGSYLAATFDRGVLRAQGVPPSWAPVAGLAGQEVTTIVERSDGGMLAGMAVLGIQRGDDHGDNWQGASQGISQGAVVSAAVDPHDPTRVLAGLNALNSGVIAYTDAGLSGWHAVDALAHPRFSAVSVGASGRWYAVSDGPTTTLNDGVYASRDQGASFEFLGPEKGPVLDHQIAGLVELDGGKRLVVSGKSFPSMQPFVESSTDEGATWSKVWSGDSATTPGRLVAGESGDCYLSLGGAGGGLLRIPSGDMPQLVERPELAGGLWDIDVCPQDERMILAIGQAVAGSAEVQLVESRDGGSTWQVLGGSTAGGEQPLSVAYHPLDCAVLLEARASGRVVQSHDGGTTWETVFESSGLLQIRQLRATRSSTPGEGTLLLDGTGGIWTAELGLGPG